MPETCNCGAYKVVTGIRSYDRWEKTLYGGEMPAEVSVRRQGVQQELTCQQCKISEWHDAPFVGENGQDDA